jgi:APA family basic amino acid/polyamine antiporter
MLCLKTMSRPSFGWQRLPRTVGTSFGIAVTIGATIGAGILRAPGLVAGYLGRSDLIIAVWISVGVISLLGANCYAELSTSMPTAGGPLEWSSKSVADRANSSHSTYGIGRNRAVTH